MKKRYLPGSGPRYTRPIIHGVLLFFALFYLLPVYLLIVTSLRSFSEINLSKMWEFPSSFGFDSFTEAWRTLAESFINSFKLVIPATLISSLLGSLNGYILAKWKFRGSEIVFTLILFGMFIPYQSILIPLVQFLQAIQLYGSLAGLTLVNIVYGLPLATLIFRNYYSAIPTELLEAGKIDGAGFFRIYSRLIFPLSAPGFVVVIIWQFTATWNEFLFGFVITNSPEQRPVTVALRNIAGSQFTVWNVQMAGALIVAIPTLLVYIFLGRYFLRGLLAGSIKG